MLPIFAEYGVQLVALSKDQPATTAFMRSKEGLSFLLLCDPALSVIRSYGLENRNGFEFIPFSLAGIPMGIPRGHRAMAVPTSILIDEAGVIRWIDQADDYRMRGDRARIESALQEVFPVAGDTARATPLAP